MWARAGERATCVGRPVDEDRRTWYRRPGKTSRTPGPCHGCWKCRSLHSLLCPATCAGGTQGRPRYRGRPTGHLDEGTKGGHTGAPAKTWQLAETGRWLQPLYKTTVRQSIFLAELGAERSDEDMTGGARRGLNPMHDADNLFADMGGCPGNLPCVEPQTGRRFLYLVCADDDRVQRGLKLLLGAVVNRNQDAATRRMCRAPVEP